MVGALGRMFIAAGAVVLLFVAYQLWGTGLQERQSQDDLTQQFSQSLQAAPAAPGAPAQPEPGLPPPAGEAVAMIRIPKIGVEKAVVEGVGVPDLKKAPGHYPGTPLPGQPGNAAIAGHRTTYGAPFFELQQLETGDEIMVRTLQGEFRYLVDRTMVVRPDQVEVLDPTEDTRLTLTTCNPRFSARQRLIVSAVLAGAPAPAPPPLVAPPPADEPPPAAALDQEAGLSGERAPNGPALVWGAVAAAVWLAIALLARVWRRWPAYLLGTPVLLVVLFVFFENVARLLPANI